MTEPIQFRRQDLHRASEFSTSTSADRNLNLWTRLTSSRLTYFFLLLGLCAFFGIALPLGSSFIFAPTEDFGVESDLRYECLPLLAIPRDPKDQAQPVLNTSCLSPVVGGPSPCRWDQKSLELGSEIACYYEAESETSIRSGLYGGDDFGKIPRYQLISAEAGERAKQFARMGGNATAGMPEIPAGDPNKRVLRLAVGPPFIELENEDLELGPIIEKWLAVEVVHYDVDHFSVSIRPQDEDSKLWRPYLPPYNYAITNASSADSLATVSFSPSSSLRRDIFQLSITRRSSKKSLFSMGLHTPFIFSKGYTEISTMLPTDIIYGLGQSNGSTFRHNFSIPRTWNLFAQYPNEHRENVSRLENVTSMWGSQPFYLGVDDPKNGDAYGVLLVNSFPIQVSSNARPSLTFKTFGGHLEFHFFLGPRPADVLRQLQTFIHKPFLPPYWALGFHVCSSACSFSFFEKSLTEHEIPLESECGKALRTQNPKSDRTYYKDFTDKQKQTLPRKYLSIEVPHRSDGTVWAEHSLSVNSTLAYLGTVRQCGTKAAITSPAYYPDVFNQAGSYPRYVASPEFHSFADGHLLDFNTPLNLELTNGTMREGNACQQMVDRLPWNGWNFGKLNEMGPCLDLTFGRVSARLNPANPALKEVAPYMALHNLYGYRQAEMVERASRETNPNRRPLVLSLSTFPGLGRFAGHVGVPLRSNWTDLRQSLKQTLDFSLFGIPLSGFPVGGYRGEARPASDELLRRWFQLAAVQPLMLAYTDIGIEPRVSIKSLTSLIRSNVQARYKLLPYLYSLFQRASTDGALVVAPLFIEFPNDTETYRINTQFMLGPSLLASPALEKGQASVRSYFPRGRWYELLSGHLTSKTDGGYTEVSAVEQNIPLHIRGGRMVANHYKTGLTIDETRAEHGFQIIGALDDARHASGSLYIDDGISLTVTSFMNVHFTFTYSNVSVRVEDSGRFCASKGAINTKVENIKLYGIIEKPANSSSVSLQRGPTMEALGPVTLLKEPVVKFQNNFGVLSIEHAFDLCESALFWLQWNYEEM